MRRLYKVVDQDTGYVRWDPEKPEDWQPPADAEVHIVCAAIKDPKTDSIVIGPRHGDATMGRHLLWLQGHCLWTGWEQGFIDQWGRFYDRKEALAIACKANQIRDKTGRPDLLYSEDLY